MLSDEIEGPDGLDRFRYDSAGRARPGLSAAVENGMASRRRPVSPGLAAMGTTTATAAMARAWRFPDRHDGLRRTVTGRSATARKTRAVAR